MSSWENDLSVQMVDGVCQQGMPWHVSHRWTSKVLVQYVVNDTLYIVWYTVSEAC